MRCASTKVHFVTMKTSKIAEHDDRARGQHVADPVVLLHEQPDEPDADNAAEIDEPFQVDRAEERLLDRVRDRAARPCLASSGLPKPKTMKPSAMPTPAAPKPAHQPIFVPSQPQAIAAQNAPRLMP